MPGLPDIRGDFPCRDVPGPRGPLIYLDNAATSQRPRQVLETLSAVYTRYNANIHRSPHGLGQAATDLYEQAHDGAARFIGARGREEIVFVRNTTEALNLVAVSLFRAGSGDLRIQPGDEVVVTVMEHHSNLVPWQALCAEAGAVLRVAGLRDDGSLDTESLASRLTSRTRLVCCTHVSNVLGVINPVSEISALVHAAGSLLLVDAAQSVPALPVDVRELGCDFLAFSGHKMLAPFGIGVLYGRRDLLSRMSPFLYGGGMIQTVSLERSTWSELPWKFEAGTPDVAAGIALGGARDRRGGLHLIGAVDYLEALGMENVREHESALAVRLLEGLARIPGVRIFGPRDPRARTALVSFSADGVDPFVLAHLLDGQGIAVRAGGHCAYPLAEALGVEGTVRVSPYIYNTPEEIDRFLETLETLISSGIS
jgi:cysteine desulfurase / selenocysteine lyase